MSLILAAAMAAGSLGLAALPAGHAEADYQQWRQTRLNNLQKPDGWLSLVGLVWLEPGRYSAGSGKDAHYQLGAGPEQLGTLELGADQALWFEPAAGASVQLDGQPVSGRVRLRSDADPAGASKLVFGEAHFTAIERGGRLALRVKSTAAPTLTGFAGLDAYAFDPRWVIEADWQPFPEPQILEIVTIVGTVEPSPSLGKAVFQKDGRTYTLQPTQSGDELFFVFGDRTNGRDTYGMARFLYAKPDASGRLVLDFNRAYNPPCAFTPYATCPMPPEGNRLDLAVTAGEKKYAAASH